MFYHFQDPGVTWSNMEFGSRSGYGGITWVLPDTTTTVTIPPGLFKIQTFVSDHRRFVWYVKQLGQAMSETHGMAKTGEGGNTCTDQSL